MVSTAVKGLGAVLLLCGSNAFMTTAWYLHLKFKSWSLVKAIFLSWLIAFFEYCLQVPANRMGHFSNGGPFTAPQLKIIQEFISLTAFAIFSVVILKEKLRWVQLGSFILILAGVGVGMIGKPPEEQAPPPPQPSVEAPPPQLEPGGGRKLQQLSVRVLPTGERAGGSTTGSSEGRDSPGGGGLPAGALAAGHELRGSASARVLVAGDSDMLAGSWQQGMRRREMPTLDAEDGPAAATPETQPASASHTPPSTPQASERAGAQEPAPK